MGITPRAMFCRFQSRVSFKTPLLSIEGHLRRYSTPVLRHVVENIILGGKVMSIVQPPSAEDSSENFKNLHLLVSKICITANMKQFAVLIVGIVDQ